MDVLLIIVIFVGGYLLWWQLEADPNMVDEQTKIRIPHLHERLLWAQDMIKHPAIIWQWYEKASGWHDLLPGEIPKWACKCMYRRK